MREIITIIIADKRLPHPISPIKKAPVFLTERFWGLLTAALQHLAG